MENKIGLTPRQQQVLAFIVAFQKENGVYPTVREICNGRIGDRQAIKKMAAYSNAHRIIQCLVRKGYIIKEVNSPRGIAVLG
tara:strand:+ start:92 stop:337 length:246 start_codon:yes stop_codon:yes gene_type:complete